MRLRHTLALAMLPLAQQAWADDYAYASVRGQFESREAQPGNPLRMRDSTRLFEHAELRWQLDAPLQNALRGTFTARHDRDGGSTIRINELSLERPLGGGFLTAGKKVMSWDVGYAFRPLDVVQQEDRRALNPVTLEGVPMLAWESFGEDSAMTVVLSNPGHGRADQPRDDGSLALRLYRHRGERDEYAVLRLSRRNGTEAGASFSHVLNEGVELHASLLWQQRHEEWQRQRWQPAGRGAKALAGFTWTTESQFSVLGEAWVDRSAVSGQERNLLLRAAQHWDTVDVSADVLYQPQNGGRIGTMSISWKQGPWLLSASWRHYGGAAGALTRSVAVATIERGF
ncbi:hypothetical protein [Massilia endophytica]|uniref:hypothetical protein n=1 Tax=Massilia endophytica TaxID=2899220 RepID=UPI001E33021C|nr:hypothetical protein [Massilia endophytica]UGQ44863.1 hypothetical protein LSQ66_13750 [Massilia endophytica]